MKDHTGCKRGFHVSNRVWYKNYATPKSISFGMYFPGGGSSGEMRMVWEELAGKETPRLKAYDDSWSALALFTDLIQKMGQADNQDITQDQFIRMIKECGFEDLTQYVQEESHE